MRETLEEVDCLGRLWRACWPVSLPSRSSQSSSLFPLLLSSDPLFKLPLGTPSESGKQVKPLLIFTYQFQLPKFIRSLLFVFRFWKPEINNDDTIGEGEEVQKALLLEKSLCFSKLCHYFSDFSHQAHRQSRYFYSPVTIKETESLRALKWGLGIKIIGEVTGPRTCSEAPV